MRTFSSMMMESLIAGGMDAQYNPEHDNSSFPRDKVRGAGLYELTPKDRSIFIVNPKQFRGKLIKLLCNYGQFILPFSTTKYKIAFMLRHPDEVKNSWEDAVGRKMCFKNTEREIPEKIFRLVYGQLTRMAILEATNRSDIDLVLVNGREVINNPRKQFQRLKNAGWPVDVEKASTIADPSIPKFSKGRELCLQ